MSAAMRGSIGLLGRLSRPSPPLFIRGSSKTMEVVGRRSAGGGGPPPLHGPLLPFPPGPRQLQQLKNWFGSAGVFGATAFALLCYFSDWKIIVAYIPFYNSKFTDEDLEVKK